MAKGGNSAVAKGGHSAVAKGGNSAVSKGRGDAWRAAGVSRRFDGNTPRGVCAPRHHV